MNYVVLVALYILSIGLMNSITLMAGYHVLMAIGIIGVMYKKGFKKSFSVLPKSAWALILLCIVIIASIVFNQDVVSNGYKNISKIKYYLIGCLSSIPLAWYFKEKLTPDQREKVLKPLLITFVVASTVATIAGLIGYYTSYNPLKMKTVSMNRNQGMFGMLMTYAHQVAFYLVCILTLIVNKDRVKKYIPMWLLYSSFAISLYGLITTYTRGALVALVGSVFLLNRKIFMISVVVCSIGLGGIYIAKPQFFKDNVIRSMSNEERLGSWIGAYHAFKEKPVLGYGFRNYESHSRRLKEKYDVRASYFVGHAHSNFFEMLATTGFIGFILFVVWIGLWFFENRGDLLFNHLSRQYIICFVLGGLTQSTFIDGENLFFILLVYSLSAVFRDRSEASLANSTV